MAAAKVTSFIQSNYSYLVFAMVILGVAVGVTAPKSMQMLKPYLLSLISIMVWAMCVTIRFRELILVTKKVKQIIRGLILNFIFLPPLSSALFLSLMISPHNTIPSSPRRSPPHMHKGFEMPNKRNECDHLQLRQEAPPISYRGSLRILRSNSSSTNSCLSSLPNSKRKHIL